MVRWREDRVLLQDYESRLHIPRFDYAVDWGYFWFLTRPIFAAIDWLNGILGNFGLAIMAFTLGVKLLFFPLANYSYRSMSKMKLLAPKMQALRERFKDEPQRMQQEMMSMYRTEKVNPASGCLPMVVQIPVFFSLYKVIFVTIEMRQAPFFGWIRDLSAVDPTNIFNLFGLIPFDPTTISPFLHLGAWPLIMGLTMFLQMKLNPPPPDPMQARMFQFMPVIFTFMLASFPAGLVIYWSWNNLLSIAQQWLIMRRTHWRDRDWRGPDRSGPAAVRGRMPVRICGAAARSVACGVGPRGSVCRPIERRQVVAAERVDGTARAGAGVGRARANASAQLLRSWRAADPGRHAGLWLCPGREGREAGLAGADVRLPARTSLATKGDVAAGCTD